MREEFSHVFLVSPKPYHKSYEVEANVSLEVPALFFCRRGDKRSQGYGNVGLLVADHPDVNIRERGRCATTLILKGIPNASIGNAVSLEMRCSLILLDLVR